MASAQAWSMCVSLAASFAVGVLVFPGPDEWCHDLGGVACALLGLGSCLALRRRAVADSMRGFFPPSYYPAHGPNDASAPSAGGRLLAVGAGAANGLVLVPMLLFGDSAAGDELCHPEALQQVARRRLLAEPCWCCALI